MHASRACARALVFALKCPVAHLRHLQAFSGHDPLTPDWIIGRLGLATPTGYKNDDGWTYRQTACHGHFGRSAFPWEGLDLVEELQSLRSVGAHA